MRENEFSHLLSSRGLSDSLTCLASSRALLLGQHLPSLTAESDEDKWVGRKVLFNSRLDWKHMSLFFTQPGVSSRLYISVLKDGKVSA